MEWRRGWTVLSLCLVTTSCGSGEPQDTSWSWDAPDEQPPERDDGWRDPPPTGTDNEDTTVTDPCGRSSYVRLLVDEVCETVARTGETWTFSSPMFRDGVLAGSFLHAVDGTNLWVIDVHDETDPRRVAMLGGLGRPIAMDRFGNRLIVASGEEGLMRVDVTDPLQPVLEDVLRLPGLALDVTVRGDRAFVALGHAGVAVVELGGEELSVAHILDVGAFVAAVDRTDAVTVLAACDSVVVADADATSVLGRGWFDEATDGDWLVAPAKDVTIVGNTAFVAAGRFGTVALDVTNRAQPRVLGNCTEETNLAFYVSGVRVDGETLIAAGGEAGMMALPVGDPAAACNVLRIPALYEVPANTPAECRPFVGPVVGSEEVFRPWRITPWSFSFAFFNFDFSFSLRFGVTWVRAPDPIQALPAGGRIYAFGDANSVAVRAVNIHRLEDDLSLPLIGRFEEPYRAERVAIHKGTLVVVGPYPSLWHDEAGAMLPTTGEVPPRGIAGGILSDGRYVVANDTELFIQGEPVHLFDALHFPAQLIVAGMRVLLPRRDGIYVIDAATGTHTLVQSPAPITEPPVIAEWEGDIVMAQIDSERALRLRHGQLQPLAPHGIFTADELVTLTRRATAPPSRVLLATTEGLVEVVAMVDHAGIALHRPDGTMSLLPLPATTYTAAVQVGERIYLVGRDPASYRSTLLTVDITGGAMLLEHVESFMGVAVGVAGEGTRLVVADADLGARVYELVEGIPVRVQVLALGRLR